MKYLKLLLISLVGCLANGHSQTFTKTDMGIKTMVNGTSIEIQFYGPSTVRILKWPEGKDFTKESLVVTKAPQKTAFKITQNGNDLSLANENLIVNLNLKSGKVSFKNSTGVSLLNEKESGATFTDFDDAE